jgi:hypothetical protein
MLPSTFIQDERTDTANRHTSSRNNYDSLSQNIRNCSTFGFLQGPLPIRSYRDGGAVARLDAKSRSHSKGRVPAFSPTSLVKTTPSDNFEVIVAASGSGKMK